MYIHICTSTLLKLFFANCCSEIMPKRDFYVLYLHVVISHCFGFYWGWQDVWGCFHFCWAGKSMACFIHIFFNCFKNTFLHFWMYLACIMHSLVSTIITTNFIKGLIILFHNEEYSNESFIIKVRFRLWQFLPLKTRSRWPGPTK